MPEPIHLLTGGPDLSQCTVACGTREAVYALRQPEAVTCSRCRELPRRRKTQGGMAEKHLQELVRQTCGLGHWLYYHTHRSQHSPAGFPDVLALREGRLIAAELKRAGQDPTPAQTRWLEAFQAVRTVDVYLWTPADLPAILEVLC